MYVVTIILKYWHTGELAQLVERVLSMHEVAGSIPAFSSMLSSCLTLLFIVMVFNFIATCSLHLYTSMLSEGLWEILSYNQTHHNHFTM